MASIEILGTTIPIEFQIGENPDRVLDQTVILQDMQAMADHINAVPDWPEHYAKAFQVMTRIVFFEGTITVNGWKMDRPNCDQPDAIFYWEGGEFLANVDPGNRANTFFHDCWHVMQYRDAGNCFANGTDEQVAREVDALNQQIAVAKLLGCPDNDITFLEGFRDAPDQIRARLAYGVEGRMTHAETAEA